MRRATRLLKAGHLLISVDSIREKTPRITKAGTGVSPFQLIFPLIHPLLLTFDTIFFDRVPALPRQAFPVMAFELPCFCALQTTELSV